MTFKGKSAFNLKKCYTQTGSSLMPKRQLLVLYVIASFGKHRTPVNVETLD